MRTEITGQDSLLAPTRPAATREMTAQKADTMWRRVEGKLTRIYYKGRKIINLGDLWTEIINISNIQNGDIKEVMT